jgi:diguanylate cyclase (GGDEF)-like protein
MTRETGRDVVLRLLDFVDRMPDLVGVCDEHGRILYLNESARKHLGVGAADELTTADFFAPEAFASYYAEVRPTLLRTGVWSGELPIRAPGGASIPMHFSVVAGVAPGGEITGLVTHGRPLSYGPAGNEPAVAFAHDAAQLVDRAVVTDWLASTLVAGVSAGQRIALVSAEIQDLRSLLERYGDFVVDGVIRAVARRMTTAIRRSDLVARVGRNAFFIAFTDVRDTAEGLRLSQTLKDTLEREAVWTAAGNVSIMLRVGLAIAHQRDNAEDAMRRAEAAAIRPTASSSRGFDLRAPHDTSMVATHDALRVAAMRGEVRTFARPIVDAQGRIVAYDAFPRWSHPVVGSIEGRALYALADQVGVGTSLNLRVLREGAAFVMTTASDVELALEAELSEALGEDLRVEQYLWEITDALALPLHDIVLRIDHHAAGRRGATSASLSALRDAGVRTVAANIDDRADLRALVEQGFTDIRLAENLIQTSVADAENRMGLERLATLAHDLGLHVSAAGITNRAAHELAQGLHVDAATGDFYGPAVAAEAMG